MEGNHFRLLRILNIETDDPAIVRRSRLLQALIGIILLASLRGIFTLVSRLQSGQPTVTDFAIFGAQLAVILLFTLGTLYLLHKGRFLISVHIFFILLNVVLFSLLISNDGVGPFPSLMLISVFSIASLHSVRASAIYLVVIAAAVSLYFFNAHPEDLENLYTFLQVAVLLTLPTWFFANDLRFSRDRANRLTQELENSVVNLDEQTKQLQQIAEIGRVATVSLQREQLLGNVVDLIQNRFNFYYVSVLLISPDGTRLVLEEACGEDGRITEDEGHELTMAQVSIVGWVAINRTARIALDTGDDPYLFNNPNLPHTRSEVALPLIARGRLLGVLDVHSREPNAFEEQDLSALQVMAEQIASGLDNARLFNDISNQASILTELQTITNLMNQQANTRNALNVLTSRISSLFNADGGGVFLYDEEEEVLKLIVNLDQEDDRPARPLKPGEGLTGEAFKENKTQAVDDYSTWSGRSTKYEEGGFHAAVSIPLRRQNEPLGVITLTRSEQGHPFKQDEIQIAELLAAQTAAVIINNRLIEETRRLVQRERTINQATAQIRRSLDAKTILDTTTAELGSLLNNKVVRARLYSEETDVPQEQAS